MSNPNELQPELDEVLAETDPWELLPDEFPCPHCGASIPLDELFMLLGAYSMSMLIRLRLQLALERKRQLPDARKDLAKPIPGHQPRPKAKPEDWDA